MNETQRAATLRDDLANIGETLNAILKQVGEIVGPQPADEDIAKPGPCCIIEELHSTVLAVQYKVNTLASQMDKLYARLSYS